MPGQRTLLPLLLLRVTWLLSDCYMVAWFLGTMLPPNYVIAFDFPLRFIPTAAVKPCAYRR